MVALLLALFACGVPDPPAPPGSRGTGAGGEDTATDTADCLVCELVDCDDDSTPRDITSEDDCAEAAVDQGCAEYTFDDNC